MKDPTEIRIAVFGGTGTGKSTLLASYFGNQQLSSFREEHGYYLVAENAGKETYSVMPTTTCRRANFLKRFEVSGDTEFIKSHQIGIDLPFGLSSGLLDAGLGWTLP